MSYEKQIILVPSDLAEVGQWVDAAYFYQQTFRGVHVTHAPSATNLCRFDVITVVGGISEWGRDMATYASEICPNVTIDFIQAAMPAELYFALQERIDSGKRYGDVQDPQQPTGFKLRWPTDFPKTTQPFRNNAAYYSQYTCNGVALPGHEGIDIRAPMYDGQGSNIYAAADGTVSVVQQTDDGSAYGAQVRIEHEYESTKYQTIYAHLTEYSIKVSLNQQVKAGQLIAISDNTGYSSGAHLHFGLKQRGATAAGATDYPCDIMDPTPYLYWPNLRLTPNARLRVRKSPSTSAETLAVVPLGTVLEPMEAHAVVLWNIWHPGTWIQVRTTTGVVGYCAAEYLEVLDSDPDVPVLPTPGGRFVAGIHGRADGEMQTADFQVVKLANMEAVKLLSTALPKDVEQLWQIDSDMFIVIRVMQVLYDHINKRVRSLTPEEYVRDYRPASGGEPKTDIERFYDMGIRYFELHNEPNLITEGFSGSWDNGREFQQWWLEVRARLMEWYPEACWGFPAMSPGSAVPGTRPEEMWDFLAQCGTAIGKADWLAIHQYWRDINEMEDGIQNIIYEYRRRWPDKLLMVTEFSNPYEDIAKSTKGQQYASYYNLVDDIPGLAAAFSYVSSASDSRFWPEAWREENGSISTIVAAVAQR